MRFSATTAARAFPDIGRTRDRRELGSIAERMAVEPRRVCLDPRALSGSLSGGGLLALPYAAELTSGWSDPLATC